MFGLKSSARASWKPLDDIQEISTAKYLRIDFIKYMDTE